MDINATLIGQLLTFILLVWFTMKYVWPPITKVMHDREKKIAAGLEAAERGKRELADAEHKALGVVRAAKAEAAEIIEQSQKRSLQIIADAKEEAKQEGARLIERARDEITREVSQTKEALRQQLATLAVAGAEKIIQRNLDASMQNGLLDEFVSEI